MSEQRQVKPRGRPKVLDRERSIEIAMQDYWQEGLYTKSLNELCKLVGMSKPGFYREFKSEDGLMEATLNRYRELRIVPLLAILAEEYPFSEGLQKALGWYIDDEENPKGCLFTKMRLLRTQLGPQTLTLVQGMEQELLTAFKDWYRRGLARNEVNNAISPELASAHIGAQITLVLVQQGLGMPAKQIKTQAQLALGVLLNQSKTLSA